MTSSIRSIAPKAFGLVLTVLAGWFLIEIVGENWNALSAWQPGLKDLALVAGLSVVYAAALLLMAETWHRIVNLYGPEPRARTFYSYTSSLIIRYIPGNVAHLIGRAYYLRDGPLSAAALGRATVFELVVTPFGAMLALAVFWPGVRGAGQPGGAEFLPTWLWYGLLAAIIAGAVFFGRIHGMARLSLIAL